MVHFWNEPCKIVPADMDVKSWDLIWSYRKFSADFENHCLQAEILTVKPQRHIFQNGGSVLPAKK